MGELSLESYKMASGGGAIFHSGCFLDDVTDYFSVAKLDNLGF